MSPNRKACIERIKEYSQQWDAHAHGTHEDWVIENGDYFKGLTRTQLYSHGVQSGLRYAQELIKATKASSKVD